jgi:DNA-binding response OmpR family regulator
VLVIDDDAALVRMIRLSCVAEGFDVATAGDGLQALESLSVRPVDIIVLDLQMPRMDGRTFFREIRKRGEQAPVIILSAYGAEEAAEELRAEAAIQKPFDPDVLVYEVRRLTRTSRLGRPGGP